MGVEMKGIHHLHKKKICGIAHKEKWKKNLDKLLLVIAVVMPLMTLPQIYKILLFRDASGVSPLTWGLYFIFSIPWLAYGIVHQEKPIIITYSLWLILDAIVAVSALVLG
jgi:uncharacterized protein with PQ loop repeat